MENAPVAPSKTHTPDPSADLAGPCYNELGGISNAVKLNTLYTFISSCQHIHKYPLPPGNWHLGFTSLLNQAIHKFYLLQLQNKLSGCPPSLWPLSRTQTASSAQYTVCQKSVGLRHQRIHPIYHRRLMAWWLTKVSVWFSLSVLWKDLRSESLKSWGPFWSAHDD